MMDDTISQHSYGGMTSQAEPLQTLCTRTKIAHRKANVKYIELLNLGLK